MKDKKFVVLGHHMFNLYKKNKKQIEDMFNKDVVFVESKEIAYSKKWRQDK